MVRISCRKEHEKLKRLKKMYNIINFMTIRYKLAASSNITHSMLNYKLMRPIGILQLHKEKKAGKNSKCKKNCEKSFERKAIKK